MILTRKRNKSAATAMDKAATETTITATENKEKAVQIKKETTMVTAKRKTERPFFRVLIAENRLLAGFLVDGILEAHYSLTHYFHEQNRTL